MKTNLDGTLSLMPFQSADDARLTHRKQLELVRDRINDEIEAMQRDAARETLKSHAEEMWDILCDTKELLSSDNDPDAEEDILDRINRLQIALDSPPAEA